MESGTNQRRAHRWLSGRKSTPLKWQPESAAGLALTSRTRHSTPPRAHGKESQEPSSALGLNYALRQIKFPSLLVLSSNDTSSLERSNWLPLKQETTDSPPLLTIRR